MNWLLGGLIGTLLVLAPLMAVFAQPWAPIWFGMRGTPVVAEPGVPIDPGDLGGGFVSDAQRYQLARAAGWSGSDSITATAISIAENGSGNPAALSAPNYDGSRDLGLWQINSGWWPQFGGPDALTIPINNAHAGFFIYGRQGWCAWSVYEASCGPGHRGTYRQFIARAQAAAQVQPPANQG